MEKYKFRKYSYLYVLILFAIFSASLRLTSNGMTSFYRMLAPAAVVFILARSINRYKKDLVFFAAMMIYSTVVSIVFYNNIEIEQIVFTVYVFFLYILIKETKIRDHGQHSVASRVSAVVTSLARIWECPLIEWIQIKLII